MGNIYVCDICGSKNVISTSSLGPIKVKGLKLRLEVSVEKKYDTTRSTDLCQECAEQIERNFKKTVKELAKKGKNDG